MSRLKVEVSPIGGEATASHSIAQGRLSLGELRPRQ